jgi:hypothetical protein
MTKLTSLVLALAFTSSSAFAAEPGADQAETTLVAPTHDAHEAVPNNQHEGKRKNDFYPKKPMDKALSTRPAKVQLLEPKAFSKISAPAVTLKWNPAEGAEAYRLQVATDPNFKWLVVQEDLYKNTSYELKNLEAGQQYFWRVSGVRAQNEAGFSSSFASQSSFETK